MCGGVRGGLDRAAQFVDVETGVGDEFADTSYCCVPPRVFGAFGGGDREREVLAQDLVVVGCPAGVRLLGCCGDGWCHVFDQVRCGDVFAARFELLCVPGQNCLGCDPGERCFAQVAAQSLHTGFGEDPFGDLGFERFPHGRWMRVVSSCARVSSYRRMVAPMPSVRSCSGRAVA